MHFQLILVLYTFEKYDVRTARIPSKCFNVSIVRRGYISLNEKTKLNFATN